MATHIDTPEHAHAQPAHLPGGRPITQHQHRRRSFLALGATAAVAATVTAETAPDPLAPLLARADDLDRQGHVLAQFGDEDGAGELWHAAWLVRDEVIRTSPRDMAGLVTQLHVFADRIEAGTRGPEDAAELRILIGHAKALAGSVVA